ncbi:MAG TPA: hypothetical protein VEI83_00650 [Acidimicrobiales bacterium]|nr:hypothetical protein [Acidimicrobiales bacterium]
MATTQTKPTTETKPTTQAKPTGHGANGRGDYVVPVVHVHVPERVVDAGFWGVLVGSVALGAVDLPLAVLLGAGVVIARHRMRAGA